MHTKLTTTKTTSKIFYQKQTQLELGRIYRLYRGYSPSRKSSDLSVSEILSVKDRETWRTRPPCQGVFPSARND